MSFLDELKSKKPLSYKNEIIIIAVYLSVVFIPGITIPLLFC